MRAADEDDDVDDDVEGTRDAGVETGRDWAGVDTAGFGFANAKAVL